jgi:hypothetical protein
MRVIQNQNTTAMKIVIVMMMKKEAILIILILFGMEIVLVASLLEEFIVLTEMTLIPMNRQVVNQDKTFVLEEVRKITGGVLCFNSVSIEKTQLRLMRNKVKMICLLLCLMVKLKRLIL